MLYLLVDTAQAEGEFARLRQWNVPFSSLFDGSPEETLLEIAPVLIEVSGLDSRDRHRVLAWAEKLAFAAPCLTWFDSKAGRAQVAEHLQRFHVVGLSEGQSMLMRWYDTRILPVWFACLTPVQAADFTNMTAHWHYVDRFGQSCDLTTSLLAGNVPQARRDGEPALALTDAQYRLLVDAADLDVLLGHLRRIIPDELGRVPLAELTSFVSHYQQLAIHGKLGDIDRQIQFVLLALYTSGKAIEQPELVQFMKSPPASLDAFVKELQALPDSVWEAGPPLWAKALKPGGTSAWSQGADDA